MSVIPPSPTVPPSPSTPSSSDWTASPRKRDPNLQPNAHPYAIRTTSTALLSRSGSSASTPVRHFYLPPPPPSPSLSRPGLGHRNAKSLDDRDKLGEALFGVPAMEIPRPLPAPPGQNRAGSASPTHRMIEANPTSTDANTDGNDNTTPNAQRRIKPRAETLPSLPFTFPGPLDTPGSSDDIIAALEHELPSNPKTWTAAQLASYLLTALRVQSPSFDNETSETSNEPIAPGIARDVASFVRSAAISGRVFLRLNDDDLDELSVPTPWRAPLLASSRALRQNVLRGRIFGFGSPVLGGDENEQYALQSPSSEPSLSAFMSGNGAPLRSPSLARLETGHLRRSRSGRVKGMVQHLERGASGSESDASDASSTSSRPSSPIRPSVLHHHPRGTVTRVPSDPPPQYSPFRAPRALPSPPEVPEEAESPIVEEQSMQELLAAQGIEPAWGARAWETEGVGETVKHVPAAATGPAQFGSMRRRELSDEDEDVNIRRSMDDLFTSDTTSLRHSGTAKSISRASGARAFGTASRAGTRAMRGVEGRRLVSALFMPDNVPANVVEPTDDKAVLAAREAEHAQATQTQENVQQAEPVRSLPTGLGIDHVPQAFAMPEASHTFEALPEPVYQAQPVSMPTYTPAVPEPEPAPAAVVMPVPVPAVSPPVPEKEEDDGTAAHIAALESELALTRSALDTMRARLSAVEARMDAIDASSAERSAVLSAALEGIKARETELRDACKVAENAQGEALKAKEEAQKMAREMKEEREREEARRKERALDKATRHAIVEEDGSLGKVVPGLPRGVAELPQYVLLVGLGVCAVALQVVLGRAGGRRLR